MGVLSIFKRRPAAESIIETAQTAEVSIHEDANFDNTQLIAATAVMTDRAEKVIAPQYTGGFGPLFSKLAAELSDKFEEIEKNAFGKMAQLKRELTEAFGNFSPERITKRYEEDVETAKNDLKDGIKRAVSTTMSDDHLDAKDLSGLYEEHYSIGQKLSNYVRSLAGYPEAHIPYVHFAWSYFRIAVLGAIILAVEFFAGMPIFRTQGNTISGAMWSLISVLVMWITAELAASGLAVILQHRKTEKDFYRHQPDGRDPLTGKVITLLSPSPASVYGTYIAMFLFVLSSALLLFGRLLWAGGMRDASTAQTGAIMIVVFSWVYFVVTLIAAPRYPKEYQLEYQRLLNEQERLTNEVKQLSETNVDDRYNMEVDRLRRVYNDEVDAAETEALETPKRLREKRDLYLAIYAHYENTVAAFRRLYQTLTNVIVQKVVALKQLDASETVAAIDPNVTQTYFDLRFAPALQDDTFTAQMKLWDIKDVELPEGKKITDFDTFRHAAEEEAKSMFKAPADLDIWSKRADIATTEEKS